jgi:hypothetical protein
MHSQCFAAARLQGEGCSLRKTVTGNVSEHQQQLALRTSLGRSLAAPQRKRLAVGARAMASAEPPDVPKSLDQPSGGREWLQSILSRFGPVRERASNTTVLDFEKPLVELDNRIKEVGAGLHMRQRLLDHLMPPPPRPRAPRGRARRIPPHRRAADHPCSAAPACAAPAAPSPARRSAAWPRRTAWT